MRPAYLSSTITDDRRIILVCRWLDALSPETARPKDDLCLYETSAWDVLLQKGWIRETPSGHFYLNDRIVPRTLDERYPVRALAIRLLIIALALALFSWLS